MPNDDNFKINQSVDKESGKTVLEVDGAKPAHNQRNNVNMEVQASHTSSPDDPNKTVATLSQPQPETKVKVKVIGPFRGETEVSKGTVLKEALIKLNESNEHTYGNYKYRDEEEAAVSISSTVDEDLVLTSVERG